MPSRQRMMMSGLLKRAIAQCGLTYTEIERATGVKRGSLLRFMRGEQSLRLDKADRLAAYFGLVVLRPRVPAKKQQRPE